MKKFLDLINIPKTIKRYVIIKRIERYTKSKRNAFWIYLIDILIMVLFLAALFYIYFINADPNLKTAGIVVLALLMVFFMVRITIFVRKYDKKNSGIKRFILINEQGVSVKTWELEGRTALLIGKNTKDNEVDIDLSDTEYASLVSRQHAVLNCAGNGWYIEDIGSANGSGIQKATEKSKSKMERGKPYKLDSGDMIYIANTKIIAK
ncbi:MAG: FHA domain-containing protein [Clostridia bacterium]|nr:FHA domain-containing protein [Clostridia bacterium]